MYRQTDKYLNPIDAWGCAFVALHALWEKVSGVMIPQKKVLEVWIKNWNEREIDLESTIKSWQGVLNDFLAFGGPRIVYLGHVGADYIPQVNEEELLLFQRPGAEHFVYGKYDYALSKDVVVWDPYENSRTVKEGVIVSKRLFRVEV